MYRRPFALDTPHKLKSESVVSIRSEGYFKSAISVSKGVKMDQNMVDCNQAI